MEPEWLTVVERRKDQRRRRLLASGLLLFLLATWILAWLRPAPFVLPMLVVVLGLGLVYVWRTGLAGRTLGFRKLRRLNVELGAFSKALSEGELDRAEAHLVKALPLCEHFGAYRATCVGLWGVLCHLRGRSQEGLDHLDAALASGWFELGRMRSARDNCVPWRALMLVSLGRLDEAEQLLGTPPMKDSSLPILLMLERENWAEALTKAENALERQTTDPSKVARSRIESLHAHAAAFGFFAAQASGVPLQPWRERVDEHPPKPLMRLNPPVARYLVTDA